MIADPVDRLREICLTFPEVTEKLSHGSPTWFVKKTFLTYVGQHHDDTRDAFWCAAPPGAQEEMISSDPMHFFYPAYVGGRGWLGVRVDLPDTDWDEIAQVAREAYLAVAPKRCVARLDGTNS